MTRNDLLMEVKVREMFLEDAKELGLSNASFLLTEEVSMRKDALRKLDKEKQS